MRMSPKVSVIMGVYNARNKKMISQAVDSILNQTFSDFEFIICDDGSENGCMEYIKKIAKKDTRIKLIKNNKNCGLAYSLNHCLKYAKGEYIARMDIDDRSCQERLEKQADFLDRNQEYAFVGSWVRLFADDDVWGIRTLKEKPEKKDFLFRKPFCHASTMFRRSALEAVNGYRVQWDTVRAEDYELYMRLYANGMTGYNLQEALYEIREDKEAYKRRSYVHRLEEAHVRMTGFYRLKLYPLAAIYVLKPLAAGLIPQRVLRILRKEEL